MKKSLASVVFAIALAAFGQKEEIRLDALLGKEFRALKLGEPIAWERTGFGYAYDDVPGYHIVILIPESGRLETILAWPTEERAREIARRLSALGPAVTTFQTRTGLMVSSYQGGMITVSLFRSGEINSILIKRRK